MAQPHAQCVCLFSWKEEEARRKEGILTQAGFEVEWFGVAGPEPMKRLKALMPDAVVIDLDRLPSHGREIAVHLRMTRATRGIPLVIAGGAPDKVETVRAVIPDAAFTSWECVVEALREAIANPLQNPFAPETVFEAYKGVPLSQKLGIKEGSTVALMGAPDSVSEILAPLPAGAELVQADGGPCDLTIWFIRDGAVLAAEMPAAHRQAESGPVWISWPKKTSGIVTDLSEKIVREAGLAAGMVDYKVCAIDTTWSGLLFRLRKPQKGA